MKKYMFLLALSLCLPGITYAAEPGWYGGFSIAHAFENFDDGGLGVEIDDSIALGAQLGFRFASDSGKAQPAIEFKYRLYDEFEISAPGFGQVGEAEAWSIAVRPKIYIGEGTTTPYVFVGLGWMDGELSISGLGSVDESDMMFEFGGGVEFSMSERAGLFIEADYVLPQGDLDDFEVWELGVGFNIRF